MSNSRNDLPSINANNFEQRVRETLMTYMGRQGDPLDRGVTLRDLTDSGLATIKGKKIIANNGGGDGDSGGGGGDGGNTIKDLTPPPTPTGFKVSAAITHVFIKHDDPMFTQGKGYLRTVVYGKVRAAEAPAPVFADAVKLSEFSGMIHAMPSDPATTWHLWIKWQTNDGVLSINPAGGTNGLSVRTGEDVSALLEVLTGAITASQLYADLQARIDLIDGPSTLGGSVAARIAAEAALRAQEIATEVQDRIASIEAETMARRAAIFAEAENRAAAILQEARNRQAAITQESTVRQQAEESLAQQITTVTASLDNKTAELDAAVRRVESAQIDANGASAAIIESLAVRMEDAEGKIETAQVNIDRKIQTLISEDSALGEQITTINSKVNDNQASLLENYYTKATADNAIADAVNVLTAKVNDNEAAAIESFRTVADEQTALSSKIETLKTEVDNNKASAEQSFSTKSDLETAVSEATTKIKTDVENAQSVVLVNYYSKSDTDKAISGKLENFENTIKDEETGVVASSGFLRNNYYNKTSAEEVLNNAVLEMEGKLLNESTGAVRSSAYLKNNFYTKTDADDAIAGKIDDFEVKIYSPTTGLVASSAFLRDNYYTKATADTAISQKIGTYKAEVDGKFTLVETEVSTAASVAQGLNAKYTVKINTVGSDGRVVVAGFGLASEPNQAGSNTSQFLVAADRFAIYGPTTTSFGTNSTAVIPFVVQSAKTVINGKEVPAGTYIADAFIKNGTITNAMIAEATITNAEIADLSAAKLTAGDGTIGNVLKSINFTPETGWRISKNGTAAFSNATVRGTVYASKGQIGGAFISNGSISSEFARPPQKAVDSIVDNPNAKAIKDIYHSNNGLLLILFADKKVGFFCEERPIRALGGFGNVQSGILPIENVEQMVAGDQFSAFLQTNGNVWLLGRFTNQYPTYGEALSHDQPYFLPGLPVIKKIAAGRDFLVLLGQDENLYVRGQYRSVFCHNRYEPANAHVSWDAPLVARISHHSVQSWSESTTEGIKKYTTGSHGTALLDGAHGAEQYTFQPDDAPGLTLKYGAKRKFTDIAAGPFHFAAIDKDGLVWATGAVSNHYHGMPGRPNPLLGLYCLSSYWDSGKFYDVKAHQIWAGHCITMVTLSTSNSGSTWQAGQLMVYGTGLGAYDPYNTPNDLVNSSGGFRPAIPSQEQTKPAANQRYKVAIGGFIKPEVNGFISDTRFAVINVLGKDQTYVWGNTWLSYRGDSTGGVYSGYVKNIKLANDFFPLLFTESTIHSVGNEGIPISLNIDGNIFAPRDRTFSISFFGASWMEGTTQTIDSSRMTYYYRLTEPTFSPYVKGTALIDDDSKPFAGHGYCFKQNGSFLLGNATGNKLEFNGSTLTYRGSLDVKTTGSSRMEITDTCIKVFENGQLRVKIGDLNA